MPKKTYFVGVDIAAANFTASIYKSPKQKGVTKEGFVNTVDGYTAFISWLESHKIHPSSCIICMEATGVYGEDIAHFLVTQGFTVSVEPPLKVKRAFDLIGHKTDPVDSRQIAEYAYRFRDELTFWRPKRGNHRKDQTPSHCQRALHQTERCDPKCPGSLCQACCSGIADPRGPRPDAERTETTHHRDRQRTCSPYLQASCDLAHDQSIEESAGIRSSVVVNVNSSNRRIS